MGSRYVTASTLLAVLLALAISPVAAQSADLRSPTPADKVVFTANRGQWDSRIEFRTEIGSEATLWFTFDGICYQLSRTVEQDRGSDWFDDGPPKCEQLMIRATFVGINNDIDVVGEGRLDYKCNYFLGNDPGKWRTGVPNYSAIVYQNLYPGIDLKYYTNRDELEYDFVLAPGADARAIQIRYEGADEVRVNSDGELEIETEWGRVTEKAPYVYQVVNGERHPIRGSYKLTGKDTFGFVLADDYDPNHPIVIDPVVTYSSFLGGSAFDYAWDVFVTQDGQAYLAGITNSQNFPTQSAIQDQLAGLFDFGITKIDLETNVILYSTFLGGTLEEARPHIDVDTGGVLYLVGRTYSSDFPTVNPYDDQLDGIDDVVVLKISNAGDTLLYSTYLGGTDEEQAVDIAADADACFYVSTITDSQDFPVVNPYQVSPSQGTKDVTLTKFMPAGDGLVYSTYLGGVQDEESRAIAIDQAGCVFIVGKTYSRDFPVANAWDADLEAGEDVFISKLSPDGSQLLFGTFMGGIDDDYAGGVALDADGNVYVAGGTESIDFPTLNAYQPEFAGGGDYVGNDLFVAKFNNSGSELCFSTYLGGSQDDHWGSVAVDQFGHVYVVGATYSADFPLVQPFDSLLVGDTDALVARLSPDGDELEYSTFLGGCETEAALAVRLDNTRNVYIMGDTRSPDFPVVNPLQGTFGGGRDFFVTKLESGCCNGLRGNFDYDGDDLVTPTDIVTMVGWLYAGESDPVCPEEADFSGNGQVDGQDLIMMVEYMWMGGPGPAECGDGTE